MDLHSRKISFNFLSIVSLSYCLSLSASSAAIIGGNANGPFPYAAILSETGEPTSIQLTNENGYIFSVGINSFGDAIVGGTRNGNLDAYAVHISSTGILTELSPLPAAGSILAVAINNQGNGLIGGNSLGNLTPPYPAYLAGVNSSGMLTLASGDPLPAEGFIQTISLNDSGYGIIGGDDNGNPYAALVSPAVIVSPLTGTNLPTPSGRIESVSINSSRNGIIGGSHAAGASYVSLVNSSGVTSSLSGPGLPIFGGTIFEVDINDSGNAIIGGTEDNSTNYYAALVSSSGYTTALSGDFPSGTSGEINAVAINNSGAGIIGGQEGITNLVYAAIVSPTGATTKIALNFAGTGYINSVAINDAGVGLIGGNDDMNEPFAAIISPTGIVTKVTGPLHPTQGEIQSVASDSMLEAIVPTSFAPTSSFAEALFAFSAELLSNHSYFHHRMNLWRKQPVKDQKIGLVADASSDPILRDSCRKNESKFSIWLDAFVANIHQNQRASTPKSTNWMTGTMLAVDYLGIQDVCIGGGVAYAFADVRIGNGLGNAKYNQEYLTLYGSWSTDHFFLNLAAWGGIYQLENVRHTLGQITSTANINGWLFLPHLEMSLPFSPSASWLIIDPLVMFDWANNWQGEVREYGPSGIDLQMDDQYTSILRSEVGVRFFEMIQCRWGRLVLAEKGSYVNKTPFHTGAQTAFFAGSISSFQVETFSNQIQNLGVIQFHAEFIPDNAKYPYGSINYQGEFGSSSQNNLISLEIGKNF